MAPQKEILITTTAGSLFHGTYLYYIYCTSKGVLNDNFHRGGPGSISDQSMWHLWMTRYHWVRIFSQSFDFPLPVSPDQRCIFTQSTSTLNRIFRNLHNIRLKIQSLLCRNVETQSYVATFLLRVAWGTFPEYRGNLFSINFL